ncbi:MAG: metallophosphoesterase [Candidatus Izemoplasmatales bacterium]|nr:metallophosphoesterase [Candidatus Izemoplasmatales bacterium]
MKLLVFSDNHKDIASIDRLIAANLDADRIISLGDSEMAEAALSSRGIFGVRGNYPWEPNFPDELIFVFAGHRTLITHGHHYYVKTGLYSLTQKALDTDCDLVLFGHTHQYAIVEQANIILLNPGSTMYPKSGGKRTYAVVLITEERIVCNIFDLDSNLALLTYVKKY